MTRGDVFNYVIPESNVGRQKGKWELYILTVPDAIIREFCALFPPSLRKILAIADWKEETMMARLRKEATA